MTGVLVSLAETAKEAAHEEFASLDAIVAGESGGGKEIERGKWRRCLETGDSRKPRTPKETQTCKEQGFVNKLQETTTNWQEIARKLWQLFAKIAEKKESWGR